MRFLWLTLLCATPALAETRVVVVPFAALQGDVPPKAGDKAAALLVEEMKAQEGLAPALAAAEVVAAAQPAHDAAVKSLGDAKALLEAGKPHEAAKLLEAAVAQLYGNAAPLADAGELAD